MPVTLRDPKLIPKEKELLKSYLQKEISDDENKYVLPFIWNKKLKVERRWFLKALKKAITLFQQA